MMKYRETQHKNTFISWNALESIKARLHFSRRLVSLNNTLRFIAYRALEVHS
jgi:hypothetical protein